VPIHLATLHYRFGSKEDLLLAVLDAATSAMISALAAMDGHPGEGLRVALTESFATLCALLDRMPPLPLVRCEVLLYACRRPAHHASAFQQRQRFLDALQACYRLACAQGELSPIAFDELAVMVGSSIDGLALQLAAGVPLTQQEATRMHVLHALLTLVPVATGPQVRNDGSTAGRPIRLFKEAIRAVRKE
jgi:AcrR family transcriptional regulator